MHSLIEKFFLFISEKGNIDLFICMLQLIAARRDKRMFNLINDTLNNSTLDFISSSCSSTSFGSCGSNDNVNNSNEIKVRYNNFNFSINSNVKNNDNQFKGNHNVINNNNNEKNIISNDSLYFIHSSACSHASPPRFEDDTKDIALYIKRSCNENVVCYDVNYESGESYILLKENPVNAYWLDIDPKYIEKNRKKKKTSNRDELNFIEKKMAYGIKVESPIDIFSFSLKNGKKNIYSLLSQIIADSNIYPVTFVAMPHHNTILSIFNVPFKISIKKNEKTTTMSTLSVSASPNDDYYNNCNNKLNSLLLPVFIGFINGKLSVLEYIDVSVTESTSFFKPFPTVNYIEIHGWELPLHDNKPHDFINGVTLMPHFERIKK